MKKFWDDQSEEEKFEIVSSLPGWILAGSLGAVCLLGWCGLI